MGYVFSDQTLAKIQITDEDDNKITLNGINGKTDDANIVMAGLSYVLDIVGWNVEEAMRIVNQDILEE